MDYIDFPYIGNMRAFDGTIFQVAWVPVPERNAAFEGPTAFRSGRWDTNAPFDIGQVGEIPERNPPRSRVLLPSRVCSNCFVGDRVWYATGWPADAPPVVLAPDGFAVGCTSAPPSGAPYDCGYDFGYQSPEQC